MRRGYTIAEYREKVDLIRSTDAARPRSPPTSSSASAARPRPSSQETLRPAAKRCASTRCTSPPTRRVPAPSPHRQHGGRRAARGQEGAPARRRGSSRSASRPRSTCAYEGTEQEVLVEGQARRHAGTAAPAATSSSTSPAKPPSATSSPCASSAPAPGRCRAPPPTTPCPWCCSATTDHLALRESVGWGLTLLDIRQSVVLYRRPDIGSTTQRRTRPGTRLRL